MRHLAGIAAFWLVLVAGAPLVHGFGFEDVVARAEALAKAPHEPAREVPQWLLGISYDQWRDIRFRPDRSLWRESGSGFEIQLFHLGLFYGRSVAINVVEADGVKAVPFSPSLFDYGANDFASRVPHDLGFAGFRLHYPIKTPDYRDEVIVFLGASYFRAVGRDQVFGLSARGLAVDTAEPSGEEFPAFREFWLLRPATRSKEVTIYALLDSPSLTGAYRFVVWPGVQTRVDVDVFLAPRSDVRKLGLAPLTSMFFLGEGSQRRVADFRPEVHDSDGLLLSLATGEWIWRPLDNPRALHVSGFQMSNLEGFGLLQRDRDFEHHQDLETRSELRPSTWVVPTGDWGPGRVELVEIPTDSDANDNIVASWIPDAPPRAGETGRWSYTLWWYGDDAQRPPGGRCIATRRDRGTMENAHRFVLDFSSKTLRAMAAESPPRAVVSIASGADSAEIVDQHVVKNSVTGDWRLTFQVRPAGSDPVDLRAFLAKDDAALTETWAHTLLP